MFKRYLLAASLLGMSGASSVHALPYGFYDARSVGMGNVSVATGGTTTAAFSNPGMLHVNEGDDTISLLLPAIGVQVIDTGDVIDSVDDFQDLEDNPTPENIAEQIEILNDINDATVLLGAVAGTAFVYSGSDYTFGVSYRADVVVAAGLTNIDVVTIDPTADVTALGLLVTEVGVPIGTDFSLGGMQVSVGVTPKMVQVDAIDYLEGIETAEIEDIEDETEEDLGSFTTFDAGITLNIFDSFRVGLVAKNLIEETKETDDGREVDFDTHVRAGAAFDAGFVTIAADMDLTERESIAGENDSKVLSVGAEFDTFSIMQLRAGYQSNISGGADDPDLFSIGAGFWFGFHLDIAAVVGEDDSLGGFIQTGFRF